ncbi:urease accessory protein UreE [Apibacter raozihei]|uniref:urease accessory protein UreE n=1 Tax=Apibacter raozihei TaxID=2500547 RepID=UPI000FE34D34|nr:urease accessory protein UreE [Apibacter raozihei]
MVIIDKIIGNSKDIDIPTKNIDFFNIEWFEAGKKILRKKTEQGREISLRLLKEGLRLKEGDILKIDSENAVIVNILPCDAIKIVPKTLLEMGSVCYEIGNKHLPLFIQQESVLIPYEEPIFRWLQVKEYRPEKTKEKLTCILNSTVRPHSHSGGIGTSILSKLINLSSNK